MKQCIGLIMFIGGHNFSNENVLQVQSKEDGWAISHQSFFYCVYLVFPFCGAENGSQGLCMLDILPLTYLPSLIKDF
jgi:hypothetical protein